MILQSSSTMPDLSNLLSSSSLALSHCPNLLPVADICDSNGSLYPVPVQTGTLELDGGNGWCCSWDRRLRYPNVHKGEISADKNGMGINVLRRNSKRVVRGDLEKSSKKANPGKSLEDHVKEWVEKKVKSGVPERKCFLPFLVNNVPRLVECRVCHKLIYPKEEVLCSVRGCQEAYHFTCVKESLGFSTSRSFQCPQHACFICKQKGYLRCMRCTIASHPKCAPWKDKLIYLKDQPRRFICWRHPEDWRFEKKLAVPTSDIEEIFCRLPLPYTEEGFRIDSMLKDMMENEMEPTPYVHIRRNTYLVKKKRGDVDADVGCTNCITECYEDCVCRVQCISCSKACHCSETCTNRPFRKDKKIKVVKTQFCGWGVEAAEPINKGDFVIEYIGEGRDITFSARRILELKKCEVIDDALCEQRLWDMKHRGDQNFYMCEIRKDFTIDATFKGNAARFLNHSCDPNCKLEKWQVDGETRVGVFADRLIKVGEPLTYDYRFVHFGPKVKCCCGALNCLGYLGAKRKINKRDLCSTKANKVDLCWGSKRRRTSTACLEIIHE
ncbi:histone-lysine N-methyltransferase ASHR3 isoform X2 [Macadamia integrifolia]|uniref:histone-lysine N-methyltransferase ASHR3 isoform X2 n=1 Tax=Macadamia integrifolia TaxID=60698 RepID=UPI001C4E73FC|nr:histone-lysine N-methyltransferase ASHR3 isoform X2 [Macadamia integrifolia]